jgi:hypothetical protein
MKPLLPAVDSPVMVGDLVWVAQPSGDTDTQPYFWGQITPIVLDRFSVSGVALRPLLYELGWL